MLKPLFVSITLILFYGESPAVYSEGVQPSTQQNASIHLGTAGSTTPSKTLKGSVQKFQLSVEKLVDVGLDLKTVLKATSNLYAEVSVQPVRIITQPEMIGSGTVINVPIGTEPTGPPRPARKKYVDAYINAMGPIIDTLKKNADEFISGEKQWDLPESIIAKIQPQLQIWINTVNTVNGLYTQLEQITIAPPYNNAAIAELSTAIEKNIKDLDKTRLVIYKVVKKETKRLSNSKV